MKDFGEVLPWESINEMNWNGLNHSLYTSSLTEMETWESVNLNVKLDQFQKLFAQRSEPHGPACIAFHCSHLYITSDI